MKTFLLLPLLCVSFSVSAQLGNYDKNGKAKILSQKTWAQIQYQKENIKSDKEAAAAAVAGSILAPLLDVGVSVIKEKIKQNALKYTSSFTISTSGSKFWEDDKNANLPIITINRNIIKNNENSEINAMKITMKPELSPDKTAFRFKIDQDFKYIYSSAKTKGSYDFIDIKIDIKFKGLIVTKSQYELKDLRATSITIPMIEVGASKLPTEVMLVSGWLPFPSMPTLEIETDVTTKETSTVATKGTKEGKQVNDNTVTTTTNLKQKSKDNQIISQNSGLYEFEITITETNPYKVKIENTQKFIEGTSETSTTFLKAIVDAIFKKEDDKKTADK